MKKTELTPEQIYVHIDKFTPIYDENFKEINPVPEDKKCTVWCSGGDIENQGFISNATGSELGLEALIAKSWILEDEIQKLCTNENTN